MTKDTNSMQYTKADYCFRVVLIGDSGVGKSSIFAKYRELHGEGNNRQKDYFETNVSKRGSKIRLKVMDTQAVKNCSILHGRVSVMFPGQERYRSLTISYFRGTHGCILCYDVTNKASFESLDRWLDDVREYVGKEIPCVIVGTNGHIIDYKREVTKEEAMGFAVKHGNHFIELIAFDNDNVESVFDKIIDIMIDNLDHRHTLQPNGTVKLGDQRNDQKSTLSCGC